MRKLCMFLLLGYKRVFSPFIGRNCKFTPTCSMYTYDAISRYGAFCGSIKGLFRVLCCNHFTKGGFQPVSENYRGNIRWLV
ncbi:MAG: membrane protein insertion efficiency factor YidD [Clostridia bacterium]